MNIIINGFELHALKSDGFHDCQPYLTTWDRNLKIQNLKAFEKYENQHSHL
jgi:hypothetical protein